MNWPLTCKFGASNAAMFCGYGQQFTDRVSAGVEVQLLDWTNDFFSVLLLNAFQRSVLKTLYWCFKNFGSFLTNLEIFFVSVRISSESTVIVQIWAENLKLLEISFAAADFSFSCLFVTVSRCAQNCRLELQIWLMWPSIHGEQFRRWKNLEMFLF